MLWVLSRTRHTIAISHGAQIGYGLYIGHCGPVIVNKTAKIGDNCNLSPYTVIGSNSFNAATIGNNVYIGPSVCVVEDVVIGDNVSIGASSVVTKSIPSNATAASNYAKVSISTIPVGLFKTLGAPLSSRLLDRVLSFGLHLCSKKTFIIYLSKSAATAWKQHL